MIRLVCTQCKSELELDDAFAGGVCRCRFCGTIQTVPSKSGQPAGTAVSVGAGTSPRTLFRTRSQTGAQGSGLDALADVVASSGLSGTGLTGGHLRVHRAAKGLKALPRKYQLMGALAALVLVLLVAGAIWWGLGGNGSGGGNSINGSGGTVKQAGPAFVGVKLRGPTVVYLLDRGSGSQDVFGDMKEACLASLASLGPKVRFQVIFWDNDTAAAVFPANGPGPASSENIAACRKMADEVFSYGSSNLATTVKKAMSASPDEIVVVTGKFAIDDDEVKKALEARGDSGVKIHTFSIGTDGAAAALKSLAGKTGGEFRTVSVGDLQAAGR